MDTSLREFYEKKIQRLQLDNILLQEQLIDKPRDDYQLKYELLLAKTTDENHLRESKRVEEQKYQQKNMEEVNSRWKQALNEKTNQLTTTIETLKNENKTLSIKNTELELKSVRLQREIDESDSEVLKLKFEGLKKENDRLRKEVGEAYSHCDNKLAEASSELLQKVEQAKEREKLSYRTQIGELEKYIGELERELDETRKKASPEREANLKSAEQQLAREREGQSRQISNITAVLQIKNKDIFNLKTQIELTEEKYSKIIQQLNVQLKGYEAQLFQKEYQKEMELTELQREMGGKRQRQAEDLKDQLRRAEEAFERERFQWKSIIEEFETQNKKIKKDWQEQKQKYIEEKNRLKDKISELRGRLKEKDDELNKDENDRMMKSLREMDSNEEHFTNYENSITFMDRQVRKSLIKLQEKDREINSLLDELKLLQEESEREIMYTRDKARIQVNSLYDKIFKLEDQVDRLESALKDKEKWVRTREKELENEKECHTAEVDNLKKIVEEMQRDYDRVTSNKKSLEQSYREERENVLTGKIDINQERKKKWKELSAQKKELQLVYKQKMAQIKNSHEIQLDKLVRQKHQINLEKEDLKAEVQALKEKLGPNTPDNKENIYSEYQAKLATLDLQISLTQNLFQCLSQATGRMQPHRKTELDQMSQEASEHLSSSEQHSFRGKEEDVEMMTPHLQSAEMGNSSVEPFRSAAFSFFPPPRNK